jgi:hypothetical protein
MSVRSPFRVSLVDGLRAVMGSCRRCARRQKIRAMARAQKFRLPKSSRVSSTIPYNSATSTKYKSRIITPQLLKQQHRIIQYGSGHPPAFPAHLIETHLSIGSERHSQYIHSQQRNTPTFAPGCADYPERCVLQLTRRPIWRCRHTQLATSSRRITRRIFGA